MGKKWDFGWQSEHALQEYLVTTHNESYNDEQQPLFSLSVSCLTMEPHQKPTQQPGPNNATPQTSKHPCLTAIALKSYFLLLNTIIKPN